MRPAYVMFRNPNSKSRMVSSLFVVAILSLGMGCAILATSLFRAVIANPLHIERPGKVCVILGAGDVPFHDRVEWWGQARALRYLALFSAGGANFHSARLHGGERIAASGVTRDFFKVFGVRPMRGDGLSGDAAAQGETEAVVSYGFWKSAYGGRGAIGDRIVVNGVPAMVVGVAPRSFRFPGNTEVWVRDDAQKLAMTLGTDHRAGKRFFGSAMIGRLAAGATLQQAQGQLRLLQRKVAKAYSARLHLNFGEPVRVESMDRAVGQSSRSRMLLIEGIAYLLLMMTCVSVSCLGLARLLGRRKELAIRLALGSSRVRILARYARGILLQAAMATVGGLLLARLGLSFIENRYGAIAPSLLGAKIGAGNALSAFAACLACVGLMVVAVSWEIRRCHPVDSLKDLQQSGTPMRHGYARTVLLLAQIGITVALLEIALAAGHHYLTLARADTGFTAKHTAIATLALPVNAKGNLQPQNVRTEILAALQGNEEVRAVGFTSRVPLAPDEEDAYLYVNGAGMVHESSYSGDYFEAMGIPILKCDGVDATSPRVVIDESLARRPGAAPLHCGSQILIDGEKEYRQVAAIVGDVKMAALSDASAPQIYLPYSQPYRGMEWGSTFTMVLQPARGDATEGQRLITRAVSGVSGTIQLTDRRSGSRLAANSIAGDRTEAELIALVSLFTALLAFTGLAASLSYWVMSRYHELGIRRALGAQDGHIAALIGRVSMLMLCGGLLSGLAISVALDRFIGSIWREFGAIPLATTAEAAGIAALAVILASLIPLRLALRVEPMDLMRQ